MTDHPWTVEPFRIEDRAELLALWRKTFAYPAADQIDRFWNWKYLQNPLADGAAPRIGIVRDGGRLVGTLGTSPAPIQSPHGIFPGRWAQDFAVDAEYRGRHVGRALFEAFRATVNPAVSMGFPPTSRTSRLARSVGFVGLPAIPFLVKVYQLAPFAERLRLPRAVASGLSIVISWRESLRKRILDRRSGSLVVDEFSRFEPEVDALSQDVLNGMIHVARDHRTLNWRYIDHPIERYVLLGARRASTLAGVAVLKIAQSPHLSYATVPEFLVRAGDDEATDSLMAAVLARCEAAQMAAVKTLISVPVLRRRFRRFGFFPFGAACDVIVAAGGAASNLVTGAVPWYLTKGDSDVDFTPDFQPAARLE
jgi:GNAT superfamily N-acetyltransferase